MEHQVLSPERRRHNWFDVWRAFVVAEGRGLVASLWRPWWKVGAVVTALAFVALAFCTLFLCVTIPDHDPPVVLILLADLGFSVFYGVLAGVFAGLVTAGVRLVGNRFYFMLLVIGLAVLITVSMRLGRLQETGAAAVDALSESAGRYGNSETHNALSGEQTFSIAKFFQLWPPVKVLASPFLVPDCQQALLDGDFLWNYFLFLRAGAFAVALGLIPSYLFALLVLWKSGFRLALERYRKFVADYGVVARYTT
jgi:hypothetical protein